MASKHFQQTLELSEQVLLCRGRMLPLTEADIRRMRIKAHYALYRQQKGSADLDSRESLKLLVDGFREYQMFKAFLSDSKARVKRHELLSIEQDLVTLSSELFAETVALREVQGIEIAIPFFEYLVDFLSGLQIADPLINLQLAEAACVVGQHYLDNAEPELAEQYLAKAFGLEHPLTDFSAATIESKIPIAPHVASALLYNLAGIYYERLLKIEPLNASQHLMLDHSHQRKRRALAAKTTDLFKLSLRLNPDNKAANLAIDSLQGFSH